jgi:hypothetical protein
MQKFIGVFALILSAASCPAHLWAQSGKVPIPAGSKVFVEPMGGFESHLRTALVGKKVPVTVVDKKEDADFDISGTAKSVKASAAKKIIMGSFHSSEDASIQVTDLKSGELAFAYSYHTSDSEHGQRSSAESCAKHLKEYIEGKK